MHSLSVREHIPLEQGLRQRVKLGVASKHSGQRAYSIRTRIKTTIATIAATAIAAVREHIPLEQGLRLLFCITL